MKRRPSIRLEQPYRPAWPWVMRACFVVLIVLSSAVTSQAAGYPGETIQTLPTEHTALVMAPLASPDQLSSAAQRMQQAGFVIYEHLGGQNGEYLLAGIKLAGDEALPDVGSPLRVLDSDIAQGSYYLVVAPPGRPQPVWSKVGVPLFDGGDHVLLRATTEQAEQVALQGAELSLLSFRPLVLPASQPDPNAAPDLLDPDPRIQSMINQVSSAALSSYEAQLSGEVQTTIGGAPYTILTRNTRSGTPIQMATQFAYEHLAAQGQGYTVQYHPWTLSGDSNRNVIAERQGLTRPNDIFIIGAHLDDMPTGTTAPGADDNGSGSAAVLLAAEILSQYQWNCTLRFALWTGEEQGLKGSDVYATQAHARNDNILGYLNLDMIGYNASAPPVVNLFWKSTVPASQTIADLFIDVVTTYSLDLVPRKYDTVYYTIGNQSDNKSFWDETYPSILAIEDYIGGDFTPSYHTVNDRLSTLDMAYFTNFTKAAIGTFAHMTGCLANVPAAATLADFSAAPRADGIEVQWQTVSEIDNTGFNVYRSLTAAQPDQLLAFVPSQAPGSTQGAAYSFLDSDVVEGQTLWYWLEDVSVDGSTDLHGPVSAQYGGPTAVTVAEMAAGAGVAAPGSWSYPILAAGLAVGIVLWSIRRKSQRQRTLL